MAKGRRPRFEPLPRCSDCVPPDDIVAPGIGIDLTTSYATAAVRYHDGSVENLVKLDATEEYREMMVRLSDPSSKSDCRPGHWSLKCSIESARRRLNKLLGRPSTPDVETLASLIQSLLINIENKDSSLDNITRALITVPDTPGLRDIDLEDAMEFLDLTLISTHKHMATTVSTVSAAFAGLGHGLCRHYIDPDVCEDEEADFQISHILALSLTHHSFSAAYTYMASAYRSNLEASSTNFDLGMQHLPDSTPDQAAYWSQVREIIVHIGRQSYGLLTTLVMVGEDAQTPEFMETVEEALYELLPGASAEQIGAMMPSASKRGKHGRDLTTRDDERLNPLYVSARGGAEFAKRALEARSGCKEPKRCEKKRKELDPKVENEDEGMVVGSEEGGARQQVPLNSNSRKGNAEL